MNQSFDEAARRYLSPSPGAFWRWSDDLEAVEWQDGGTIAFATEVLAALQRLAPAGLPPFDLVVLTLAVCRKDWPSRVRQQLGDDAALPAVPRDVLDSPGHKAALVELVVGTRRDTSPARARDIVRGLEAGFVSAPAGDARDFDTPTLPSWFSVVSAALAPLSREQIQLRIETGLDATPDPAELELPDAERARQLIDALRDDPELGGIAAVARDLRAAIHVPRPVAEREDLPLGGVSEITNRGSLDRLLISELAHDDEVLGVRIALGEALYMRREAPPERPERQRFVLVDPGIRTWGLPRAFATSVALAIAAADGDARVTVVRPEGSTLADVALFDRDGLIEHLRTLTAAPHPGPALPAVFAACEASPAAEVVVITHEDVLDDPEFAAQLVPPDGVELFVATVSREGRYRLVAIGPRGRRTLSEAILDVEPLRPRVTKRPVRSDRLPALVSAAELPFRLPHEFRERAVVDPEIGLISATKDGRLLLSEYARVGGRQLTTDLPAGTPWRVMLDERRVFVVSRHGQTASASCFDLDTFDSASCELAGPNRQLLACQVSAGILIAFWEDRIEAIDVTRGVVLDREEPGGYPAAAYVVSGGRLGRTNFPPPAPKRPPRTFGALPNQVWRTLQGVAISEDGHLGIVDRRGRSWGIVDGLRFRERRTRRRFGFGPTQQIPGASFSLARAELPHGHAAWFDSRGLLHLLDAEASNPEISLVTIQTHPTALARTHRRARCGSQRFLVDPPTVDLATGDGWLRAFVEGLQ